MKGTYQFADHRSHFLYGKLFCAECGEPYRRYTAQIASGTHKVWRCRGRVNRNGCHNKQIDEDVLLAAIRNASGDEADALQENESIHDKRILVTKQGVIIEKQMAVESA